MKRTTGAIKAFTIKVTDQEWAMVRAAAQKAGVAPHAFAKRMLLGGTADEYLDNLQGDYVADDARVALTAATWASETPLVSIEPCGPGAPLLTLAKG